MGAKLKNSEILSSLKAIDELMEMESVPVKLTYAASKNKKRLEREKDDLQDFQKNLLQRHAVVDETTGMIKTKEDEDGNPTDNIMFQSENDKEMYVQMMNDLYNEEVDLSVHQVDVDRVESVELPPSLVFALRWMFETGDLREN